MVPSGARSDTQSSMVHFTTDRGRGKGLRSSHASTARRLHRDYPNSFGSWRSMSLRARPVTPQDKTLPNNDFKRSLWSERCSVFLQIYCGFHVIQVPWCSFTEHYWDGSKYLGDTCIDIYKRITELAVITWLTAQYWLLGHSSVKYLC